MEKLTDVELSSVVLEEAKTRTWEKGHSNSVIVQVRSTAGYLMARGSLGDCLFFSEP